MAGPGDQQKKCCSEARGGGYVSHCVARQWQADNRGAMGA